MEKFCAFMADNISYVLIFAGFILFLGVFILVLCVQQNKSKKKDLKLDKKDVELNETIDKEKNTEQNKDNDLADNEETKE